MTPVQADPADETKPYAGPPRHDAHAVPNAGHDGPKMDIAPMPTRVVVMLVAAFAVLFALLFAVGWWPRHDSRGTAEADAKEQADGKTVVGVAMPKMPTKLPMLEVPGDAQAFQIANLYARTSGYLKRRLVDIGDNVKEGQLLAEIDTPEVVAQLAAADANLQQSRSAQRRAKDDFDLAKSTFERYEGFAKTGGVTQQQLDERKSALTNATAALAGADAMVKAGEAEVQRLTALQGFSKIVAPFAGKVTQRGYDVGALLTANNSSGQALFQVAQVDTLRVFVDIPQSYASGVTVGEKVVFAVRNHAGRTFDGHIARTSGAINQNTRTMRVEADFPNAEGLLYPGMYGTLRYELKQQERQFVIPTSSLVFGPEGMRVATVGDDNKIKFKKVTLGTDLGTEVEVTNGIAKNERVVNNPGERLRDGLDVQVEEKKSPQPQQAAGGEKKSDGQAAEASAR